MEAFLSGRGISRRHLQSGPHHEIRWDAGPSIRYAPPCPALPSPASPYPAPPSPADTRMLHTARFDERAVRHE